MNAAAAAPRAPVDTTAFDRSSLTVYLKDVVTLVLENRPADPIAFIADYLRRVLSGASPVSRAYQYITLSPHHRQAFMDNAVVAFSVLDAGGEKEGGSCLFFLFVFSKTFETATLPPHLPIKNETDRETECQSATDPAHRPSWTDGRGPRQAAAHVMRRLSR